LKRIINRTFQVKNEECTERPLPQKKFEANWKTNEVKSFS